jgi:hypothetical protein
VSVGTWMPVQNTVRMCQNSLHFLLSRRLTSLKTDRLG